MDFRIYGLAGRDTDHPDQVREQIIFRDFLAELPDYVKSGLSPIGGDFR
jgi:hypothetical protein